MHCLKCKKKTSTRNQRTERKGGRVYIRGECQQCGAGKCQFGKGSVADNNASQNAQAGNIPPPPSQSLNSARIAVAARYNPNPKSNSATSSNQAAAVSSSLTGSTSNVARAAASMRRSGQKPGRPLRGRGLEDRKTYNPPRSLFAKMSEEVYKPIAERKPIDGWNIVKHRQSDRIQAWKRPDSSFPGNRFIPYIIAIRGTDPKSKQDLASDAHIAMGTLKTTDRYKKDKEAVRSLMINAGLTSSNPQMTDVRLTGHSLGGKIASEIAKQFGLKAIVFNRGASYTDVYSSQVDKAACALKGISGKAKRRCEKARNVENVRTKLDPVSIFSSFDQNTKHVGSKGLEQHGVSNFT